LDLVGWADYSKKRRQKRNKQIAQMKYFIVFLFGHYAKSQENREKSVRTFGGKGDGSVETTGRAAATELSGN
jgi:hypothetical protein